MRQKAALYKIFKASTRVQSYGSNWPDVTSTYLDIFLDKILPALAVSSSVSSAVWRLIFHHLLTHFRHFTCVFCVNTHIHGKLIICNSVIKVL